MKDLNLTVLNLATTSDEVPVFNSAERSELGIAAIEAPATLTTNTGQFEMSDNGVDWQAVQDNFGSLITFSLVAGRITILPPTTTYFVKPYIRLKLTNAVSADRVFKVYFREVS